MLFAYKNLPNCHICNFKKETVKELNILKSEMQNILSDKQYLMIMDSLTVGEKINKNKNYSFYLNLESAIKKLNKEIKKEKTYINKYCSPYYINNKLLKFKKKKIFNDVFYVFNISFVQLFKNKNYYNHNIPFIPCLLNKQLKTVIWRPKTLQKNFSDIKFFCNFLRKNYKNRKTFLFLNIVKIP